MDRDLTITEVVQALEGQYGITVSGRTVRRACARGLVPFRRTPQRLYLINESHLQLVAETVAKKGS